MEGSARIWNGWKVQPDSGMDGWLGIVGNGWEWLGMVGNGWGGWGGWGGMVTFPPVNGELDVNRLGTSPMEVVRVE